MRYGIFIYRYMVIIANPRVFEYFIILWQALKSDTSSAKCQYHLYTDMICTYHFTQKWFIFYNRDHEPCTISIYPLVILTLTVNELTTGANNIRYLCNKYPIGNSTFMRWASFSKQTTETLGIVTTENTQTDRSHIILSLQKNTQTPQHCAECMTRGDMARIS